MTTEPDTERLLLLAQIALEGVLMTLEAQEVATMERLRAILGYAQYRSKHGRAQAMYHVERGADGSTPIVVGTGVPGG